MLRIEHRSDWRLGGARFRRRNRITPHGQVKQEQGDGENPEQRRSREQNKERAVSHLSYIRPPLTRVKDFTMKRPESEAGLASKGKGEALKSLRVNELGSFRVGATEGYELHTTDSVSYTHLRA